MDEYEQSRYRSLVSGLKSIVGLIDNAVSKSDKLTDSINKNVIVNNDGYESGVLEEINSSLLTTKSQFNNLIGKLNRKIAEAAKED